MQKPVEPKKILCIHDLSGVGRCSLAVILPVLSVMGFQPVALPTVVLSTHTGGLGTPARMDGSAYGMAALEHYQALELQFDCIYTGYLGGEAQVALAEKAFALWPAAYKVVDPVMGDNGKAYSTVTPALIERIRNLCRAADLILPNYTEAQLLLQQQPVAKDLRQISAALKMITDMERIGDQAEDIAEIITFLGGRGAENSNLLREMARSTIKMVTESVDAYVKHDTALADQVIAEDDTVDDYFASVKKDLIKRIAQDPDDGEFALDLLMIAKYFERIGDHALNLQESAKELHEKQLTFSTIAREEVDVLTSLLEDLLNSALRSFQSDDPQMARQVEPLEETMDLLTEEIRSRHIRRLQSGQCTIQLGFILNDLLNNAERVGDHCSNIAVSVIEEQEKQAASHAYLHSLKKNDEFSFQLQQNLSRYVLPAETAEDQPAE